MTQSSSTLTQWVSVCSIDDILPNTGVCALVGENQVAVFRVGEADIYAIDNFDPFSKAYVLSRGIVGDSLRYDTPKVASPIYKQNFSLKTGECLDDPTVRVTTYPVQILDQVIQVGLA
jgi:nitrite reductase (NADH) small subunit